MVIGVVSSEVGGNIKRKWRVSEGGMVEDDAGRTKEGVTR